MSRPAFCALDVGISTTDAVAEWAEDRPVSLPTRDPLETAASALARLLDSSPPPAGGAVVIAATGFGSHRIGERLAGLPVRKVPELRAIGRGGTGVAGVKEGLVVSLGTGTAMVSVRLDDMRHVSPGTGVGGGTLVGLARNVFALDDLDAFASLAAEGDRSRVDLSIGEVVGGPLGALPPEATASNLGKWSAEVRRADLAAGFVNLVAEVVLTTTFLGLQASGQARVILVGKLLFFEPIRRRVAEVTQAFGSLFVLPERGAVATALGALWTVRDGDDPGRPSSSSRS